MRIPHRPDKNIMERSPMDISFRFDQFPPEYCLPVIFKPPVPPENHVRPEEEILVKEVGDPRGELKLFEIAFAVSKIGFYGLKPKMVKQGREDAHDIPGHDYGFVW